MLRWFSMMLACVGLATAASGQVNLRFDPSDTTLAVGATCRLSIMIEESVAIRTIDVTVNYDAAVVQSLSGGAGSLYTSSGIFTFQGFEQPNVGQWHGYAVLMGAEFSIHGPGELYYWNLKALANGSTPITSVEVFVSTTDGSWFSSVLLPPGVVKVGPQTSQVGDSLPMRNPSLALWPNPFNPRTEIKAIVPESGWTTVTVYDVRGSRVASLLDGPAEAGPLDVSWDGRDDDGRSVPGGMYVFVVTAPHLQASAKGVLLK